MRGATAIGRRCAGVSLAVLGIATAASPVWAAAPGLPRTYDHRVLDSPEPLGGGAFGWGLASADLTGDTEVDLLVAQAQTGKGQIFIFDGVSGEHIDTINPPEKNPPTASGAPANNETLAFVYVETMPDIGSCPGGDGADSDEICDLPTIAGGDGIPEILAGSRNLKVNATDGSQPPVAADPNIGRTYVFDGATRAVLKRIDMPQADRMAQATLNASPQYGRAVLSLQAMPPCAGAAAENNAIGVGPCPDLPRSVRIGDVSPADPDADDHPDLVITARNFVEARSAAAPSSQCFSATASGTCTSGKAWVYEGEDIAGTDPQTILETPLYSIQNPDPQTTGSGEFGGNVLRVGDVVRPDPANANATIAGADGAPEFVIAARTLDYPLKAPDPAFPDVGAAYLFNGANGRLFSTLVNPEPQPRSYFSLSFNFGRPTGDLGASTNPDILLPAPFQNVHSTDDGRAWAMNAVGGGGGATGSWQFATLTDPTPVVGGNFGGAHTGVGDLVEAPAAPANEVLVGGFFFDPFTSSAKDQVADLHIMNVETQKNLQTIPHPEGTRGDGFGVGLAPLGDLNDDGFLDIAASAYLANVGPNAGAGRAYILTSNNTPPEAAPTPVPTPPGPTATPSSAPVPVAAPLKPGVCVNEVMGTGVAEELFGTLTGDTIFGLGGDDFINGFQGEDCIDGGAGRDRIDGGSDADKLVGRSGPDRLKGRDGHDRLYGASGNDSLVGDYGRDMLAGGPGRDAVDGGPDADRLFGEGGRDRIKAGDGRNEVDGGGGSDVIDTRNGERDVILCGTGRDTARVDRADSVNGCERVRRSRR